MNIRRGGSKGRAKVVGEILTEMLLLDNEESSAQQLAENLEDWQLQQLEKLVRLANIMKKMMQKKMDRAVNAYLNEQANTQGE